MAALPLISSRRSLAPIVSSLAGEVELLTTRDSAVEYLNTEMPDLFILDFCSRRIDTSGLLNYIKSDPWLLHGGIIALCDSYGEKAAVEKIRGLNIIVSLTRDEMQHRLPEVMRIIECNRRILFQREIGTDFLGNISETFSIGNDLLEASCYTNLVCNFLYNTSRIDAPGKESLRMALLELLINAIEHGNCGITYAEKTAVLENGGSINDLIARRCRDPAIAKRRVTFEYHQEAARACFSITDQGAGFDWRSVANEAHDEGLLRLHGRGIMMARLSTQQLSYNEAGNSVTFELACPEKIPLLTPALFSNIDPVETAPGQIIFTQGETSNHLYYIVKGEYDVVVGDTTVSFLAPDDLFMGEMSFLLDNRRSATVVARTPGRLIRISKKEFVGAIRRKPHYALFLARLLAQRVQRANTASR
ncbi:MAG: cyclic nucleotide-binding domain-containing protein [Chitinispirillaceae bacterium]|jgi:CRP-like cAMP-binding protein|nr:cyclic nucleotide-binding domain-containing protein [Chitinispirillaceae bacterium]